MFYDVIRYLLPITAYRQKKYICIIYFIGSIELHYSLDQKHSHPPKRTLFPSPLRRLRGQKIHLNVQIEQNG